jgi:indole-3-acetate monooxygenase
MQIRADTTLIEAAQRIAPVIREHNEEAERARRLSPPVLAALHEAGLLRMCTPRSLGGLEVDPITRAVVIEEISGYDSAAGWTLANPLDWAYLCARLPDEGAEEIYGRGANVVIAAQFGRPMQAAPTQGGYRITGRAPFVSNCHDANWIATSAMVMASDQTRPGGEGEPELVMVYLPRENCQVIDTWYVMGMRGTGSNDVTVTDVFVPATRTFPIVPEFTPGSHYQGPLYRFPIIGTVASNLPPLLLAVARRAIDEVAALAQDKVPVARSTPLRERPLAQAKLAQAEGVLRAGRLLLLRHFERSVAGCAGPRDILAKTKGGPPARYDPRSQQRGGGGGVGVQRCGHKRDLYEEPAGTLLPGRPGIEASRVWRRDPL